MAIQDILTAIDQETAQKLDFTRRKHQQELIALKRESEDRLEEVRVSIDEQKREKLKQLDLKVQGLTHQKKRHLFTTTKQRLLNQLYHALLQSLAEQSEEKVSAFLKKKIESFGAHHGTILPSKRHKALCECLIAHHSHLKLGKEIPATGGFRFVSDKLEYDMTFESLVENTLRPKTELSATTALFS